LCHIDDQQQPVAMIATNDVPATYARPQGSASTLAWQLHHHQITRSSRSINAIGHGMAT
jgi:hypothetical protein